MTKKKKVWCRRHNTGLGWKSGIWFLTGKYKKGPKRRGRRWRCPDCGQRFVICSSREEDGIVFWGPAHKKTVKVNGSMGEQADPVDSKSAAERRPGSNPGGATKKRKKKRPCGGVGIHRGLKIPRR